jgi:hypothetical protein
MFPIRTIDQMSTKFYHEDQIESQRPNTQTIRTQHKMQIQLFTMQAYKLYLKPLRRGEYLRK